MVFKPGNCANPGGKPKQKAFTDALRVHLLHYSDEYYEPPAKETNLSVIARKLVEKAKEGCATSIKEIADRIEGKSEASVNVEHSGSVTHEHEGVPATLGWLGEIRGKDTAGETTEPVLN